MITEVWEWFQSKLLYILRRDWIRGSRKGGDQMGEITVGKPEVVTASTISKERARFWIKRSDDWRSVIQDWRVWEDRMKCVKGKRKRKRTGMFGGNWREKGGSFLIQILGMTLVQEKFEGKMIGGKSRERIWRRFALRVEEFERQTRGSWRRAGLKRNRGCGSEVLFDCWQDNGFLST